MNKFFVPLFIIIALGIAGVTTTSEVEAKPSKHKKHKHTDASQKEKTKKSPSKHTHAESGKKEAAPHAHAESAAITAPGTAPIKLKAKQAILLDYTTGKVLLERNADEQMTPSSMTKMMTAYLIEEKIRKKQATLDTQFLVSEKAWRMGGSKMFVTLGSMVSLGDLLKGIIIQSGNDACIVASEGLSGSEENFVQEMNVKAKEMGLLHTVFKNTSGWPEEGHYSTARDLATLGLRVVRDFPESYGLYKESKFKFNNIEQGNRNPLLYKNVGCDGIKTGHTEDGGYGVVASFVDGGQRYVMVVNGLPTMQSRADETMKILTWAKQNFMSRTVFKKGDIAEKSAPTWLGVKETIPLAAGDDVTLLVPRTEQDKVEVKIIYDSPVHAPLKQGDVVGKISVTSPFATQEVPLIAAEDCEKVGMFTRLWRSVQYLIWGKPGE